MRSLDGQWRFKIEQDGDHPEHGKIGGPVPAAKVPAKFEPFEKLDYIEDAKWTALGVPGNWEMSGHSPATFNQPDSAIGLYRLLFDVPADWKGRVVKVKRPSRTAPRAREGPRSWTSLRYNGTRARQLRYHPRGSLSMEEKT